MKTKNISEFILDFLLWLILVTGLGLLAALFMPTKVKACCPEVPPGYECFNEAFAILPASSQIHFDWYTGDTDMYVGLTHVTAYFAIFFAEVEGVTYEVQYTDDPFSGAPWKAYARWVGQKNDIVTTDVPVYPCAPQRYYRVCAQLPAPRVMLRRFNTTLNTSLIP